MGAYNPGALMVTTYTARVRKNRQARKRYARKRSKANLPYRGSPTSRGSIAAGNYTEPSMFKNPLKRALEESRRDFIIWQRDVKPGMILKDAIAAERGWREEIQKRKKIVVQILNIPLVYHPPAIESS
jgi:hypothetical protein